MISERGSGQKSVLALDYDVDKQPEPDPELHGCVVQRSNPGVQARGTGGPAVLQPAQPAREVQARGPPGARQPYQGGMRTPLYSLQAGPRRDRRLPHQDLSSRRGAEGLVRGPGRPIGAHSYASVVRRRVREAARTEVLGVARGPDKRPLRLRLHPRQIRLLHDSPRLDHFVISFYFIHFFSFSTFAKRFLFN